MGLKVLIPMDWSENCQKAFHWYVESLLQHDTMVYLCHNIESSSAADLKRKESSLHTLQEEYEHKLMDFGAEFEWVVGTAKNAGELLISVAREKNVDMIVMGARGLGKVKKAILGSCSDYVMKKTGVPVLICK